MVVQEDDTEWPEAPPSIPQEEDRVECGCCFESCAFDSMVQIRKCFSHDVWLKYERRMAEEAVAKAQLAGLVYCYHCNHPWEVDPGIKILVCINQSCLKDPEDTVRTQVEESMTKAVIRVCSSCGAELFKLEGCNKHIRAPQVAPCEECSMCCLWETEDVNKVVKAAKSAAIEKLAERYPEVVRRQIGPSEDPVRKRPCKERVGMI
ncbi:hypothetical protein AXG93_436s1250 [Marchantia polymorpha subsp. ruderalis]|uniref:RING-type domain-containing protein n=1 Tax=Marchantia polymorpha subsp. ruderalis TaxID=1480154 RepID=A0A176VBR9_MARPO|nr:hypothetical protein AXG93_436s1250 [Marchantia polymorpha subsp. ruderalis]